MTAESDNDSPSNTNRQADCANLAALAAQAIQLDVRGLNCPMPLLKAKQALNKLEGGALLQVQATDPGSVRDFEVFAKQSGHRLLSSQAEPGEPEVFVYLLQKKVG